MLALQHFCSFPGPYFMDSKIAPAAAVAHQCPGQSSRGRRTSENSTYISSAETESHAHT